MTVPVRRPLDQLRDDIPAVQECIYLNPGTIGPTPAPVLSDVECLRTKFGMSGYLDPVENATRLDQVAHARAEVAGFLGVDASEIGFPANASEGMHLIAAGVGLQNGDEVITTDQEHGGGIWPWQSVARLTGAQVRQIPIDEGGGVLENLKRAITPRTRIIMISHVSHTTGSRLPVAEVARLARKIGAWSVLDCAQSLTQVPVDPKRWGCDALVSSCHKWTLAPRGTGLAYVRRERLADLEAVYVQPKQRKMGLVRAEQVFEYGTRDLLGPIAAASSLHFLQAFGIDTLRNRIKFLSDRLKERLRSLDGLRLLTPDAWEDSSGLVSFRLDRQDHSEVVRALWNEYRIAVCHLFGEPQGIRVSTAPFNTEAEIDQLVLALEALMQRC